jgi:FHA domain-containing protein
MRTLKVTSGPSAGRTIEVDHELVIGREDCELTIADPELSRRHMAIRPIERGVEVEDLGSMNGTFVGGTRIEAPTEITENATIKAGVNLIAIELSFPDVTRPQAIPAPDVTAPRAIPDPDVTAPRAIPDPDVTAPRKIPDPDVTAPRALPDPDVTAPRQIADPDVTAPRSVPPPQPPREAPEEEGGGGGRRGLLIGVALGVLALIVIILLVAGGGDDAKSEDVDMSLRLSPATPKDQRAFRAPAQSGGQPIRFTLTGQASGTPFGPGTASVDVTRAKAKDTHRIVLRFEGGTVQISDTVRPADAPSGQSRDKGSGQFTAGTGDYEGIEGDVKVTGVRKGARTTFETVTITGTAEY